MPRETIVPPRWAPLQQPAKNQKPQTIAVVRPQHKQTSPENNNHNKNTSLHASNTADNNNSSSFPEPIKPNQSNNHPSIPINAVKPRPKPTSPVKPTRTSSIQQKTTTNSQNNNNLWNIPSKIPPNIQYQPNNNFQQQKVQNNPSPPNLPKRPNNPSSSKNIAPGPNVRKYGILDPNENTIRKTTKNGSNNQQLGGFHCNAQEYSQNIKLMQSKVLGVTSLAETNRPKFKFKPIQGVPDKKNNPSVKEIDKNLNYYSNFKKTTTNSSENLPAPPKEILNKTDSSTGSSGNENDFDENRRESRDDLNSSSDSVS